MCAGSLVVWNEYVERVKKYDSVAHTWVSVHTHLCGGERVKLKPSQLNMLDASWTLKRLLLAGLAFAEVSDEFIEQKHRVYKLLLPLNRLYRSIHSANFARAELSREVDTELLDSFGAICTDKALIRAGVPQAILDALGCIGLRRERLLNGLLEKRFMLEFGADVIPWIPLTEDAAALNVGQPAFVVGERIMDPDTSESDDFEMCRWESPTVNTLDQQEQTTRSQQKFTLLRACATGCESIGPLEIRFCFGTGVIKIVRSDNNNRTAGKPMQWIVEFRMLDVARVVTGARDDSVLGKIEAVFTLSRRPKHFKRDFTRGPRAWTETTGQPSGITWGMLGGVYDNAWLTVVGDSERLKRAINAAKEDWGATTDDGIGLMEVIHCDSCELFEQTMQRQQTLWSQGYSNPHLCWHREQVDSVFFTKHDNSSDLVNAMRNGEDDMLRQIVTQVNMCVINYRTPGYTHPMRCGCCRHMTRLNEDGVRVRDIDGTMHYVCYDWGKCVTELVDSRTHKFIVDLLSRCFESVRLSK